ncbi:MAG: HAMP domain-containing protein, partial [Pirellulaceae bacterium]|nr:HAMP domain-containing protein [Pirellulaceae bacterium]
MLFRWPIKFKLFLCVGLLFVIVGVLAVNSLQGLYAYRELAKTISWRADELPLADELSSRIGHAQDSLRGFKPIHDAEIVARPEPLDKTTTKVFFNHNLKAVRDSLQQYRDHLDMDLPQFGQLGDRSRDRETLGQIAASLERLEKSKDEADWLLVPGHVDGLIKQLSQMRDQVDALKPQLYERMRNLSSEVRGQYQTWISISWATGILSSVGLFVLLGLVYSWVTSPLNVLIRGSRRIAKNDEFEHRIHLRTHDEMAELAENMNAMTARFLEIKTDQETKIQQRTQEVVRSEQLASVGFLAAGVAHEINNPLAAIAMCAESLESRVTNLLGSGSVSSKNNASDREVVAKYLRRIQDEAFRCKGITERLLDFSRLGDVKKQPTDLRELVIGVVEMVRHIGDYREKKVEFQCSQHVVAPVNAQEMKQVVLNLITNSLDSLDPGGTVWVELRRLGNQAELLVRDNGCGMSTEVLKHLFEPFYTRRRDGK